MTPNRNLVAVNALCVLVGALVALMAHWDVQPLILITP